MLAAVAIAGPVGAAPAPTTPDVQPIFEAFTKLKRSSEPAVIGIRARSGFAADVSKQVGHVRDGSGAAETAWNVVRTSVSVPLMLVKSLLQAALDPLSNAPPAANLGSGFIVDDQGHVLTVLETIRGFDSLEGSLDDGRVVPLKLLGTDPDIDVALLGLPRDVARDRRLRKVELGDSDTATPGHWVMAMGCPVGNDRTATVGLVTGVGRDLEIGPFDEYLETDSAVVPGSSGGPLFDDRGTVVGINSVSAAKGENVGFAIPINAAKAAIADLQEGHAPLRGSLGATLLPVRGGRKAEYALQVTSGALVTGVDPDGPAAHAGIMPGDVIVAVGGRITPKPRDVTVELRDVSAGHAVVLTIDRRGARLDLPVTLAAPPTEGAP